MFHASLLPFWSEIMALAIAPAVHASETATIPADYTIAPLTVEQYHAMAAAGILE